MSGKQLYCASLVSLGFYSSFCLLLIEIITAMVIILML